MSQLLVAKGMCRSKISLGLILRVSHKVGLEATSNNCQKTLLSRLGPANNPSKNRPTMNMSESSIKLLAMTTASSIGLS